MVTAGKYSPGMGCGWRVGRWDRTGSCRGHCWALTPLSTQDYLLKIIDTPGLLNPEQVSALFGNIESIYALNRYGVSLTHPMFLL